MGRCEHLGAHLSVGQVVAYQGDPHAVVPVWSRPDLWEALRCYPFAVRRLLPARSRDGLPSGDRSHLFKYVAVGLAMLATITSAPMLYPIRRRNGTGVFRAGVDVATGAAARRLA
jgi:hypothetical protein